MVRLAKCAKIVEKPVKIFNNLLEFIKGANN